MRKTIKKFSRQSFILSLLLLATTLTFAQSTVTGKITDPAGAGIPGVSISVKGGRAATQTSTDGSFSISAPNNATLVISSIGFATQEVAVNGRSSVDVTMSTTNAQLNEVVLIGYGTRQRKDLTGSITQVSSKDFQKGVITTPEQLIAGKVAGVSVISNSGQPGAGSTIRIRGGSSLNASNDPLIVIDGVPLDASRTSDGRSAISGSSDPLSFINSNDIESFTVLKDASASAIYGTRASNGVIIITTKKGRSGKMRLNFTSVNSLSVNRKHIEVLSGDQLRAVVNANGNAAQKAQLGTANTDWQSEIYQKALASDNNISMTGGFKKVPYRISLGYLNQDGILRTDHFSKYSGSVVLNPVLLDNHLKIDINLKGAIEKYRFANQGAISSAVFFDPTLPVTSGDKRFGGYTTRLGSTNNIIANPLSLLYDRNDNSNAQRSIGNIQIDYKFHFLPDLHANVNLGYDVSKGTGTIFISDSSASGYPIYPLSPTFVGSGENNTYKQTKKNTIVDLYLNYIKEFTSLRTKIDIVGGYSYNNFLTTSYNFARYYANGKQVPNSDPQFPFNKPEHTLLSYFGRANIVINDKYLLTGTIRQDQSSRFAPGYRKATFPSVAFAWKLKSESFLRDNSVLSDLKLRLGYGITGQQDGIGDYDYQSRYALSNPSASYQFGSTFYQGYRPAGYYAPLRWEETATSNIAVDFGFFNSRINGSIDFYLKKTSALLNVVPVAAGTNFSAFILANVGDMENKGVELTLNVQPVRNKNITWDVSFNGTYNKNTITNLTVIPKDPNYAGFPEINVAGGQGFVFLNAVGFSKRTFNFYHQVYDNNGNPIEGLFEDVNRDGIINESDKYKGKRADPNIFAGFSTSVSYKKWSAGFVLRAAFNNYVYNNLYSNNGRLTQIIGSQFVNNASINYLTTKFTGTTDKQLFSDFYLQNASFLKMDNLNIGYNVGKIIRDKATLGLNFSVQNVFTITNYTGMDPERGNGVDNSFYPRPRIYALGLNLDF